MYPLFIILKEREGCKISNTYAEFLQNKSDKNVAGRDRSGYPESGYSGSKSESNISIQESGKKLVKEERIWKKDEWALREDKTRQQRGGITSMAHEC